MGEYSGNHPRYSKKGDETYDAHEAYNKDLTASARLHYLENERHDHHPGKQTENVLVDDSALDAKGSDAYATRPDQEGHEGGKEIPVDDSWDFETQDPGGAYAAKWGTSKSTPTPSGPVRESSRDWGHGKHEYLRHRNAAGVETKTGGVGGGKYGKGGHFKAWEKNN